MENIESSMNNNDFENNDWPMISVVVPIRNEERFIDQTLEYIRNQDYPKDKLEILVVDGRSTDRTREIVEQIGAEDSRVKLLDNPKCLSSAARNVGAREAEGDIVMYIDGHVYIDNDQLLKNTAILMHEKEVDALSRPQFLDTPENTFFQKAVSLARKSPLGHGLDSTIYSRDDMYVDPTSSGATYKKEVFEKVGYFDEDFDAAEDVEFNYRVGKAGIKSFTSMKLMVYYYPRESLKLLFKQLTRYGTGRFRFLRKHSEAISSGALIPPGIFIGMAVLILMAIIAPVTSPLLKLYMSLYILAVLISSGVVATNHGLPYLFILPQIYICIHGGLAWGFISEAFRTLLGKR